MTWPDDDDLCLSNRDGAFEDKTKPRADRDGTYRKRTTGRRESKVALATDADGIATAKS